jgi:hypothetical protein
MVDVSYAWHRGCPGRGHDGDRLAEGTVPNEIAVLVSSPAELKRASAASRQTPKVSPDRPGPCGGGNDAPGKASGIPRRGSDGMNEDVLPLQEEIETVGDDTHLHWAYNTERHLLYVACTPLGTICLDRSQAGFRVPGGREPSIARVIRPDPLAFRLCRLREKALCSGNNRS